MSIDRSEFDELVQRVANLERRHDAAMELIAAELVGLRSHIDDDVQHVIDHVNMSEARLSAKLDANHGVLTTILRRIEGGESGD
jgi:hypothetical protein